MANNLLQTGDTQPVLIYRADGTMERYLAVADLALGRQAQSSITRPRSLAFKLWSSLRSLFHW